MKRDVTDLGTVLLAQLRVCEQHGVAHVASPLHLKVGIAANVRNGMQPLNGLRHPPEGDTTGWYIWAGEELSTEPDFFAPLHVEHLAQWCPEVLRFLGLPPGTRFLVSGEQEDVWHDDSLLKIE